MQTRSLLPFLVVALATGCGKDRNPSLIQASGHVEATEIRVSAKVGGRLSRFALQEGDSVTAGQELAELDTTDARLALRQVQAERAQAQAELHLRLAGARKEDIAELLAQVNSVEVELESAQRDFQRMQALLDKGSGTTKSRDDARTRADVASARLAAIKQSLARLRSGSRAEEVDSARARVAAADARIAQIAEQIADARITSPAAGVVTEKVVEPGELLQAGALLCVVTNLADAWLTVYVAETDLGRIRLGQEAEVVTDDGQTRKGRIIFIAAKAEFTPKNVQTRDERVKLVYRLKIGLPNADGLFKPGMPAEARLHAAETSR